VILSSLLQLQNATLFDLAWLGFLLVIGLGCASVGFALGAAWKEAKWRWWRDYWWLREDL
jgi:hypothetical protein